MKIHPQTSRRKVRSRHSLLFAGLLMITGIVGGCNEPKQDNLLIPPLTDEPDSKFRDRPANSGGAKDDPAPKVYFVEFETTAGNFVVRVKRKIEPPAADRFFALVENKFFDNSRIYHCDEGRGFEFGLAADPENNKKWDTFSEERKGDATYNTRGTLSFVLDSGREMERATRIFINQRDNGHLDNHCAAFGAVTNQEGMAVVDQLYGRYRQKPDLNKIRELGNAYLEEEFPKLDVIKTARIIDEPEPGPETDEPADETGLLELPELKK